jgi:hypothetical protein
MRWSAGPLREILLLFSPTDTMSHAGEPTGSKYGCPAAQFANSTGCGRATGLPSPCSIAPSPSSTSSLADHRLRGRTGRHRWRCGVPDVHPSRLRHGPRTLPRLRPRPPGSIPPLADESAVSRHGADQVRSVLASFVERPIGMIRREYPDQPLPSLWGNRQRKSDVSSDQHTTVRRHRASGPHAPDSPARTALRTNEEPMHPLGAAGSHCEYSLALALADRTFAHHTLAALEMLPSGTLRGSMRCDNL